MRFSIFLGNHGKRYGIEEFINILSDVITKRGHEVEVAEVLNPDAVNIIIDEFTDFISNMEIIDFKRQNPGSKLVYLLTEFIECRLFVKSFNFFDSIVEAAAISAMNVYFRTHRRDFNLPTFSHWITAILYSPLLLVYLLNHFLHYWFTYSFRRKLSRQNNLTLLSRAHRTAYMLMRYLGLEKMVVYADAIILSHDSIAENLEDIAGSIPTLGTIYPEISFKEIESSLFLNKQLFFEITGSITPYRLKVLHKINMNIIRLGIKNRFELCKPISFCSSKKLNDVRGAYSLHPPQSKKWKYSSPTRIFRALQYEHNIPVLTKIFNQHPIEKLCLEYKGEESLLEMYNFFKEPGALVNRLEPLIREYNNLASIENNKILDNIYDKFYK